MYITFINAHDMNEHIYSSVFDYETIEETIEAIIRRISTVYHPARIVDEITIKHTMGDSNE